MLISFGCTQLRKAQIGRITFPVSSSLSQNTKSLSLEQNSLMAVARYTSLAGLQKSHATSPIFRYLHMSSTNLDGIRPFSMFPRLSLGPNSTLCFPAVYANQIPFSPALCVYRLLITLLCRFVHLDESVLYAPLTIFIESVSPLNTKNLIPDASSPSYERILRSAVEAVMSDFFMSFSSSTSFCSEFPNFVSKIVFFIFWSSLDRFFAKKQQRTAELYTSAVHMFAYLIF